MSRNDALTRLATGAVAGLAGTFVIQGLMALSKKVAPQASPPMRKDPGEFMTQRAESVLPATAVQKIPQTAEKVAAKSIGMGYGMTFGALYALSRPDGGCPVTEGLTVGMLVWAAGYLGWLPATGLMPPVWKQKAPQVAGPLVTHAAYGAATVAAYDWLAEHV